MLAAGRAERFGAQKLLHPLRGGDTLLERAIRASGEYPAIVVTSSALRERVEALGARAIVNDEPERGMAHSLRLANEAIDPAHTIAVLPADLLLIEPADVHAVVEASMGRDVTYPVRADATPGHPVVFSARARTFIAQLADNTPIARVRDRDDLVRLMLVTDDAWPYLDVDTPGDLA